MRSLFIAMALVCGGVEICYAKPLMIRWTPYKQGSVVAERFIVYRALRGTVTGAMAPYDVVRDVAGSAYVDNAVIPAREYCYELRAVTSNGAISPISNRACAIPKP